MTVFFWACLQLLPQAAIESDPIVGMVHAVRQTTVSAETSGRIARRYDVELKMLKQGAAILRIDDSLQRAEFRSAVAQLRASSAQLSFASSELRRLRTLAADDASSKAAIEQAEAAEEAAKASVAIAEAATARAEFFVSKTRVAAPFAGVLTRLFPNEGEYVRVGQPLFQIMDPTSVRVESWVDAQTARTLSIGQAVTITSGGCTVDGKITGVAVGTDNPARTLKVVVSASNEPLKSGRRPLQVGVRVYWSVGR